MSRNISHSPWRSLLGISFLLIGLLTISSVAQLGLPVPPVGGVPVGVVIGLPLPPAGGGGGTLPSLPGAPSLPGTPGSSPASSLPSWLLGLNTAQGAAPLTVRFAVQGPAGTPFILSFGDGKSQTGVCSLAAVILEHLFSATGEFTATLQVGGQTIASTKIKVLASGSTSPSPKVTLGLAANLTVGVAPLGVNFNVLGQVGTNFVLDFGDGKIFAGAMASASITVGHVFSVAGNFTVVLKVDGQITAIINVNVLASTTSPSTNATLGLTANVTTGLAPLAVSFSIQGSVGASFVLNFADGKLFAGKITLGLKISHVFLNVGNFTVILQIGGQTTSTRIAVLASGAAASLSANFGVSASVTTGPAPLAVNFFIQGPTGAPFICNFGDGKIFVGIVTPGLTIPHVFPLPGLFPVSLISGGQEVANIKITVLESQAQAPFGLTPDVTVGVAPLTVNFEIQGLLGAPFACDFGDGKSESGKITLGLRISHIFVNVGNFNVVLKVDGREVANTKITVLPSDQSQQPAFGLTADVTTGPAPLTVNFAIQGPLGAGFVCDFGDGKSESGKITLGLRLSHIFVNVGDFNVVLKAADGREVAKVRITVLPSNQSQQPTFGLTADVTTGIAPLTVNFTIQGPEGSPFLCDFGDGASQTGKILALGLRIPHVFVKVGDFNVVLKVDGREVADVKITVQSPGSSSSTLLPNKTFNGQAISVIGTIFGNQTVLADTGPLPSLGVSREATEIMVNIPDVLRAEGLHATTVSEKDKVTSTAFLAKLSLTVGGNSITADFVMGKATASCTSEGPTSATHVNIAALSVNGQAVEMADFPNLELPLVNGKIVINEQVKISNGKSIEIIVNALHIVVDGVADIILGMARSGIACGE